MTTLFTAPTRVGAYARLAKLDIWDYYLAVPLAWSLCGPARDDPAALATLGLFLIGAVGVVAGAVAFDDVAGFRDGRDWANCAPRDSASAAAPPRRRLHRKPLLTGELTEREAVLFGWGATLFGLLVWTWTVAFAEHHPLWSVLLLAGCFFGAVQYSRGIKISYRGLQEVVLAGFGAGLVLAAVGLCTGELTGFAVVQAALFGFGPLLVGVYANTRDARGDASVGRPTAAVLLTGRGNRLFIAALTAAEVGLVVAASLLGAAPWWFALAMLPATGLRAAQLRHGVGYGDLAGARLLGLHAHRVTVSLLILVNLFAPLLGGH
ncbi:UbiA family prenyltransferase [Actinokineospora guangxiensis]|uniref:UbiA family prenyltransferase n=1 Tax=Actinokineospora guangxiensis TaxID=1490288 RepID=A0ABW0EVP2_9PSEU